MKGVKITDKYIAFIDTNLNNEQVQVQMPYDEFVNLCKPAIDEYIRKNEKWIEKRETFSVLRELQVDNYQGTSITYYKESNAADWKMADTETYKKYVRKHLLEG